MARLILVLLLFAALALALAAGAVLWRALLAPARPAAPIPEDRMPPLARNLAYALLLLLLLGVTSGALVGP